LENKIDEAIVLAGGLGQRLRSEIGELPKSMAMVNGQPFLHFLFHYLNNQGIRSVILSVGYKWETIRDYFGYDYKGLKITYAVEEDPLGTGGGIRLALEKIEGDTTFVLNGDTFFKIDLNELALVHTENSADCTLALKTLKEVDRYGLVEMEGKRIIAFKEKEYRKKTIINGGIYCINKSTLFNFQTNTNFSFEKDYLEINPKRKLIYGCLFEHYFKDIGIPEDYRQFEIDME